MPTRKYLPSCSILDRTYLLHFHTFCFSKINTNHNLAYSCIVCSGYCGGHENKIKAIAGLTAFSKEDKSGLAAIVIYYCGRTATGKTNIFLG